MKRLVFALLAALSLTGSAFAQTQIDTGSITAGGADCSTPTRCASFTVPPGAVSLTLAVSGTFSATLITEASSDSGVTWFTALAVKLADGSGTSAPTTGQYAVANAGVTNIRVRCSAYVSGTAVITAVRGYATAKWLSPFLNSLTFANGTVLADTSGSGKLLITGTTPMVQLGGTTSSFPGLKRNSARMQVQLADDSGPAALDALSMTTQGGGFAFSSAADAFFLAGGATKLFMGTAPSAPSTCGTSPTVTSSNGSVVLVVTGGTGGTATGCTVTMPTASTGWVCSVNNITGSAAHRADKTTVQTASTTTSVTWEYQTVSTGAAVAFTASDVFRATCFAY